MISRPRFLTLAILLYTLIAGSPLAAQHSIEPADRPNIIQPDSTRPAQKRPRTGYRPSRKKPVKSSYNNSLTIAAIRAGAIRQTLADLERLRPYTTNFNHLRSDIRRYWQHNITRPTTRGLAGTIMRHVKTFYKGLVRSQVYAGSRAGIIKVKKALKKRK